MPKSSKPPIPRVKPTRQGELIAQYEQYATIRSGPLPDPQYLEHYERIEPGTANRILTMAETQAAHRQKIEKIVITSNARDSLLGIVCAFGLGLATIVCGTIVIILGHGMYGTILGGAGLTGLVGAFIYGTRSSRQERAEKDKQDNP